MYAAILGVSIPFLLLVAKDLSGTVTVLIIPEKIEMILVYFGFEEEEEAGREWLQCWQRGEVEEDNKITYLSRIILDKRRVVRVKINIFPDLGSQILVWFCHLTVVAT